MSSTSSVPPYSYTDIGTHPAPWSYTIPASLEVETAAITCDFDGSNASGSFNLVAQLVSAAGYNINTVPVGTGFNTGDAGEVSWFPFAPPTTASGGVQDVESPHVTIDVTNNTGPVVDIDLYEWREEGAPAYDLTSLDDISDVFDQDGWFWLGDIQGSRANSPSRGWYPGYGNMLYTVSHPEHFESGAIGIPFDAFDTDPTKWGGANPGPVTAIVGHGLVSQLSTGDTFAFTFQVNIDNPWLMQMVLDGTAGTLVDATHPVTFDTGDTIAGFWVAALGPK